MAVLWVLVAATGCSFIYDADVFAEEADAAPPPDAEIPPPDVNISALALSGVSPSEVFEGAGCIAEGATCAAASRGVPIVVSGSSIAPTATATIDGAGFDNVAVDVTISADGTMLAFELTVPVIAALADGATDTITITVSQGTVTDNVVLTVRGLDELVASVDASGGTLDAAALKSLYSTIDIDTAVELTGSTAARLAATASINVNATLSANGGESGTTSAGPGGCTGGAAETPGNCLGGGGRAGGSSAGGGGGGHSTMGSQGASGGGGAGGDATGSLELVPLSDEGGNGGGGGGNGAVAGNGGAGGGGGGVIEVHSLGGLTIGSSASITADGGGGAGGSGSCALLDQHGGGGGGGAGGAILIRGAMQITDDGSGARVSVSPGAKGNDGCNAGGDGAPGRVRVDVPAADPTPSFAGSTLYRGPMLSPATPLIVTSSPLSVELFGDASTGYFIERDGDTRASVSTGSDRRATHDVALAPGLNRICAVVRMDVNINSPEGTNCLTVALIQ